MRAYRTKNSNVAHVYGCSPEKFRVPLPDDHGLEMCGRCALMKRRADQMAASRDEFDRRLRCIDVRPTWIYVLRDPDTLEPRYVGKTVHVDLRAWQHASAPHSAQLWDWVQELAGRDRKPLLVPIWRADSCEDTRPIERMWINHFRERGAKLMNWDMP